MKRLIMVHGWQGKPNEGFRPWLKKELEMQGFAVSVPEMPNANFPQQSEWVSYLATLVGRPDTDTYFMGHSLGAITILRYLETLPEEHKVGGAVMVAGFSDDINIKELTNFYQTPIMWSKIKRHSTNFVAIHSDNDYYVPLFHGDVFEKYLDAKLIVVPGMKHFSGDDGIIELPVVYDEIMRISK